MKFGEMPSTPTEWFIRGLGWQYLGGYYAIGAAKSCARMATEALTHNQSVVVAREGQLVLPGTNST